MEEEMKRKEKQNHQIIDLLRPKTISRIVFWVALLLLLLQTSNPVQINSIKGQVANSPLICSEANLGYHFPVHLKKGLELAIYLDSKEIGSNQFIDDGQGNKKFVIVSRGKDCYKFSSNNRFRFLSFYVETHPDPNPEDPTKPFYCKVEKFILSNELVQCSNNELTALPKVDETFIFSGTNRKENTWDKIKPDSKLKLKDVYLKPVPKIETNLLEFKPNNINDRFIEMLVAKPLANYASFQLSRFSRHTLQTQQTIQDQVDGDKRIVTGKSLLERMTHNGLPGYHFSAMSEEDNGIIGFYNPKEREYLQRGYILHFYIGNLEGFDKRNRASIIITFKPSKIVANKVPLFLYQILLQKVGNVVQIMFRRRDARGLVSGHLKSLEVDVEITNEKQFIHFGVQVSGTLFYYKSDSEVQALVYEAVWALHDNKRYLSNTRFEQPVPLANYILPGDDIYLFIFLKFNYIPDRTKEGKAALNKFGVRFWRAIMGNSAFPLEARSSSLTVEENNNYENRCGYLMFTANQCGGFASIRSRGNTSEWFHGLNYYNARPACSRENCYICTFYQDCLYPLEGFNRELVAPLNSYSFSPMERLSEFEGDSPEAIAKREGRVLFEDNLKNKYWLKCLGYCKKCDENLKCSECKNQDQPTPTVEGHCNCPIANCLSCLSNKKCGDCKFGYFILQSQEDPSASSCTDKCPPGMARNENDLTKCYICPQNCKTCYFLNSKLVCTSCVPESAKIDYRESRYLNEADPRFENRLCEPNGSLIDGFYYAKSKDRFLSCIKYCKRCSNSKICEVCQKPLSRSNGVFLDSSGLCQNCPSTCSKCTSTTTCQGCIDGYYLLNLKEGACVTCPSVGYRIKDGRCLKECGAREYPDADNLCKSCPDYCQKCSDVDGICGECQSGFILRKENNECWKTCQAQEYNSDPSTCSRCSENCLECEDLTRRCLKCEEYYIIDKISSTCKLFSLPVSILRSGFNSRTNEVYIIFNQKINIENLEKLEFSLKNGQKEEKEKENSSTDLNPIRSMPVLSESGERISSILNLNQLDQELEDSIIQISEGVQNNIKSSQNTSVLFKDYPISIPNVSYFNSEIAIAAVQIVDVSSKAFNFLSVFLLALSISFAVAMIKLYQLIYFLMFINLEIPGNAQSMIEMFKMSLLDYAQSLRKLIWGDKGKDGVKRRVMQMDRVREGGFAGGCLTHRRFDENGLSCDAFDNIESYLIQFAVFLLIKLTIRLFLLVTDLFKRKRMNERNRIIGTKNNTIPPKKLSTDKIDPIDEKKECFLVKIIRKGDKFFSISYYINYLRAAQLKVLLGVMVSFSTINQKVFQKRFPWSDVVIIAITLALYFTQSVILLVIIYQRRRARKKKELDTLKVHKAIIDALDLKTEFKSEENEEKNGGQETVFIATFLFDFLMPVALVVFINNSIAQILILLLIKLINLVLVSWYTPYKLGVRNFLEITNSLFYIMILVTFLTMKAVEGRVSKRSNFRVFGMILMALIALLMSINFVSITISVCARLGAICRKKEGGEGTEEKREQGKTGKERIRKNPFKSKRDKLRSKLGDRRRKNLPQVQEFEHGEIESAQKPSEPAKNHSGLSNQKNIIKKSRDDVQAARKSNRQRPVFKNGGQANRKVKNNMEVGDDNLNSSALFNLIDEPKDQGMDDNQKKSQDQKTS